jgi:schlafen family protein
VAVNSLAELFESLGRRELDAVLGTPEGPWLDFKEQSYKLDTPRGVADMVADIAAFANTRDGVLLLGVHEDALEDTRQAVASRIRGVRPQDVNDDQVLKLVRQHILPLAQVEIRRYQVRDTDRQVVAIVVNAVPEHERPCVVDRVVSADGERVSHAIGWPIRHGADTHWETPGRMQQLLAVGLRPNLSPAAQDLDHPGRDVADEQLEALTSLDDWENRPHLVVQAIPENPAGPLPDFFGEFTRVARGWRGIRPHGFNLGLDEPSLERTSKQLLVADSHRYVAIHRSGVFTAAVNGTPAMLGWSLNNPVPWRELTVVVANPYVVVEFSTEAVRFAADALASVLEARSWTYRVIGENLKADPPLYLRPRPSTFSFQAHDRPPSSDGFDESVTATDDLWRDAFEVVAEIYGAGWGLGRDDVPFAEDGRIDLALLG